MAKSTAVTVKAVRALGVGTPGAQIISGVNHVIATGKTLKAANSNCEEAFAQAFVRSRQELKQPLPTFLIFLR